MDSSFLTFDSGEVRYAVPLAAVREIAPLPYLSRVMDSPAYIPGLALMRGRLIPVIDLERRLGLERRLYKLSTKLLVLGHRGRRFGLVVDAAGEIVRLQPADILPVPTYGHAGETSSRFLAGLGRSPGQAVNLLDLDHLVSLPDVVEPPAPSEGGQAPGFAGVSPEELKQFKARARALEPTLETAAPTDVTMIVVRLGRELFGVEAGSIREVGLAQATFPVPLAPAHVVGLTRLRGSILTLVDIRAELDLAVGPWEQPTPFLVVEPGLVVAGVLVEEICALVSVARQDLGESAPDNPFVEGTAPYRNRIVCLLALERILTQPSWVNTNQEEVQP